MADATEFDIAFRALTGHDPFPWQRKLYGRLIGGDIPPSCDIPTGLGKTAVAAVWLIGLAKCPEKVPRRLVYVVNRRTVVDQTTNEAMKLRENAAKIGIDNLAISTLRGQFADNREWSADPSRPAIICGTVDMIGSRLLFSGYRIGFKSRPLHAGFLGQDALLVHDEAHLEPAFQNLIEDIEREQETERQRGANVRWPRLRVMALSATARNGEENGQAEEPFELTPEEKNPPDDIPEPRDDEPPIHRVWRRLIAMKVLALHQAGDGKDAVAKEIAERAADYKDSNAAVLVFVRTLDDINTIAKEVAKTKRSILLLTGTMRGKERDELVEKSTFKRFLKDAQRGETVYLLCTSAGEVGIDISADHMVCDLSTFESMAQRFGRVNRFGDGDARIDVVYPASFGKVDKKTGELKADEIDKRRQKTLDLLRNLPETHAQSENGAPIYDASPKKLSELKGRSDLPCKIADAFSPTPTMLDATDILFDAWALTTIRDKLPGRPEVAPYLHGVADDLPQTTIAWRAELDLIDTEFPDTERALQAIFTKHRVRPHETLTIGMTKRHGKWKLRAIDFLEEVAAKRPDLRDSRIAIQSMRGLRLTTVGELLDDPGPLNADPTLVLPASFGGLDDKGMLSADAIPKTKESQRESDTAHGDEEWQLEDTGGTPSSTLDIADHDGYERYEKAPTRMRVLIDRTDDAWSARAVLRGKPLPAGWRLEPSYETWTRLVNQIRKQSGLNVRLVQAIAFDDEGAPVRSLVCLSPAPQPQPREEQSLADHLPAVEREAQRLADALELKEPYRSALLFAAKWHDEGKKAHRWQRYIGGPDSSGQPLAKSAKWRDPKLLAGYRHEFGSLLRIPDGEARRYFADPQRNLTAEQQDDARDLALHLIAAHHGYGRPHFVNPLDDDFATECEETHLDAIRRYARLQRKYGRWGLAYLESLLRAADAAASRAFGLDPEADDDDAIDTDGVNA